MNKEELYKEIDSIEQHISRIYFDIVDQVEISLFKKRLIEEKLNLLAIKLKIIIYAISFMNNMETMEIKKKLKRTSLLSMLVLVVLFVNPLLALPLNLYTLHRLMKLKNQLFNPEEEARAKEVEKQLQIIETMVQNCYTFMGAKYAKREERILAETKNNDQELRNINTANEVLGEILYTGNVSEMSDDIKLYLIKILQEDLGTNEESLEELVRMAIEKISFETLNDALGLKMNLVKNSPKE